MEISDNRKEELINFTQRFGLKFQNFELLNRAFVHTSFTNENNLSHTDSYERLEFLGDAVLKIAISDFLFKTYPDKNEGELTNQRAWVVSDRQLSVFAKEIDLGGLILLGKNEESMGGRDKTSILACAFEAFLGAIFLEYGDDGLKTAYDFLINNFADEILVSRMENHKQMLQEFTQSQNHSLPQYRILDEFGLAHEKTYVAGVFYNDALIAKGEGKSKKDAEQAAAKEALLALNVEGTV